MITENNLDADGWASISLMEQMANIGSEVGRTCKWLMKGKSDMAEKAFIRSLDLIDLTIQYGRYNQPGRGELLKELCRLRECFCEAYINHDINTLKMMDKDLGHYATAFCRNIA